MQLLHLLLPLLSSAAEVVITNEKCKHCQFLIETFQEGLKKTARHHFAGGDTAWEEKNLGKYATSETRLVEITKGLCKKKTLPTFPEKFNGLSELEFKGDGSPQGTGKCKCHVGYSGQLCRHCDSEYYEVEKTESTVKCEKCFEGCLGGCKSGGPVGCNNCKTGYEIKQGEGCVDIDECSAEVSPCQKANERCLNNAGSYICECAGGYKKRDDQCVLDIEGKVYNC